MTEYSKTVSTAVAPEKAIEVARSTFMSLDFRIVSCSGRELRVEGKGMRNTKQNPLKGITEATILASRSGIDIQAVLGGVDWMRRFVLIFPLALGGFLTLVFGVLSIFVPTMRNPLVLLAPILSLAPWPIIGPFMARWIKQRTEQAIDALLENMGEGGGIERPS